jgi:hypothetical protein
MDLWMEIDYKGKSAGKIRFKSRWEPEEDAGKDKVEGMMAEAQAALVSLAHKKKELEQEFAAVNARIAEHEASYEGRLAAVAGGDADDSVYNEVVAQIQA